MNKIITKKLFVIFLLYVLLAILVFCFFDIYFFGYRTNLSHLVSKIVPYPALIVNSDVVTIKQYEEFLIDYESYLKEYNLRSNKFSQELMLKTIIRNIVLEQIIAKLKLNVSKQEFDNYKDDFYKRNNIINTKQVAKNKLENYFLKPAFYQQKIKNKISEDSFNLKNKKKIELIYGDLVKHPEKFDDYAHLYKDISLNAIGNRIGWLSYVDLPDSLKEKVDKLEVDDFTPILKSTSGYHIYKLKGKINKNGNYYYQFEQIFLPLKKFNNFLNSFIRQSKIFCFLK